MAFRRTVVATYRVRKGKEGAFRALLRRHWPALRAAGLVRGAPSVVYQGEESKGGTIFFEVFDWKSAAAVDRAHHDPRVLAVWGPMHDCCEPRDGKPAMDFPHVTRIAVHGRGR